MVLHIIVSFYKRVAYQTYAEPNIKYHFGMILVLAIDSHKETLNNTSWHFSPQKDALHELTGCGCTLSLHDL